MSSLSRLSDVLQRFPWTGRFEKSALRSFIGLTSNSGFASFRSSKNQTKIAVKHRRVEIESSNFDHMFSLWFSIDELTCLPWNIPSGRGYGTWLEWSYRKSISQVLIDMISKVTQLIDNIFEMIRAASAHTTLKTTNVTVKKPRKMLIFKCS